MDNDGLYLGHMLDTANNARRKVQGVSRADYDANETLRLALAHLIQIVGEAAGRVSSPTREQHPEIPWHEVIGMRHRIVHDYLELDEDTIWEVVMQDLPKLIESLNAILEGNPGP